VSVGPQVNRGLNLGLIGSSVSRSLSPFIHQAFFNCTGIAGSYRLFDVSESQLASRLAVMTKGPEAMDGINVTLPHKVAVFDFLENCSPQARAAGAVNTVVFKEQKLEGHNTDIVGLRASLEQSLSLSSLKGIAIIGTGGAARAAVIALAEMGATDFQIFGRSKERADAFVTSLEQSIALSQLSLPQLTLRSFAVDAQENFSAAVEHCQLVINATSIGHLDSELPPWLEPMFMALPKAVFVQDLVYAKNSEPTICCRLAQKYQLENSDGKAMLVHQARFAFALFAGQLPPYEVGLKALLEACAKANS
jgi:shikimate dehydrogenase